MSQQIQVISQKFYLERTERSFGKLYQVLQPIVYNISHQILRNHHDAEDNVSLVFTKIHNAADKFTFKEDKTVWTGAFEDLNRRLDKLQDNIERFEDQLEEPRERQFDQPSTFVGTVIYSPDLSVMSIELNGRTYGYCGVPQRVFDSFKGAFSKGQFYNSAIKGNYQC